MPRSWLRRHGAPTAEKHHELAALHELPPTRTRPYGQKALSRRFWVILVVSSPRLSLPVFHPTPRVSPHRRGCSAAFEVRSGSCVTSVA